MVERNGQRSPLTITPTAHTEDGETAGFLDFVPDYGDVPVVVREVEPSTPAAEAGLQPGDRIMAIGGQPVGSAEQVTQFIQRSQRPADYAYRQSQRAAAKTLPQRRASFPMDASAWVFVRTKRFRLQRVGLVAATAYAVNTNLEILRLTGKALGQVFTGNALPATHFPGPIGIYNAAAASVERLAGPAFLACSGS